MSEVLEAIDGQISAAQERLAGIDREIADKRAERQGVAAEVRRLKNARATITGERRKPGAARGAAAKAGPAAIEKVRKTLAEDLHGRATQAKITEATGLNSGVVSAAVKALGEAGVLRETGVRVGRTKEVEIIKSERSQRRARARMRAVA